MRVALISKADSYGGGASRVAVELAQLLGDAGHTAHHYASWHGGDFQVFSRQLYPQYCNRLFRAIHLGSMLAGFPELLPLEYARLKNILKEYDVAHFHDISSAISPLTVFWVSQLMPTFWTIHDCSPFTGGCLYPMDCNRFIQQCGQCPQLGEWPIKCVFDFTSFMCGIKKKMARQGSLHYVTPSRWMRDMAVASGCFKNVPTVVPNGVDVELFRPQDKDPLRKELALPQGKKWVLLSAGSILDERKGTKYALEALRRVSDLNLSLLLVGNMSQAARELLQGFDYHSTGYIGDSRLMAKYYAAADIFFFCSLADNMPLVVLETMSSGVPTVGFATGGVPEMVVHEETGYIVTQKDIDSLVTGLRRAFKNNQYVEWGIKSRKFVEEKFSYKVFLENHISLYSSFQN